MKSKLCHVMIDQTISSRNTSLQASRVVPSSVYSPANALAISQRWKAQSPFMSLSVLQTPSPPRSSSSKYLIHSHYYPNSASPHYHAPLTSFSKKQCGGHFLLSTIIPNPPPIPPPTPPPNPPQIPSPIPRPDRSPHPPNSSPNLPPSLSRTPIPLHPNNEYPSYASAPPDANPSRTSPFLRTPTRHTTDTPSPLRHTRQTHRNEEIEDGDGRGKRLGCGMLSSTPDMAM